MIEKTAKEFVADAEKYLIGAAVNDDFVRIKTSAGNAVLISEAEWNVLIGAFNILTGSQK